MRKICLFRSKPPCGKARRVLGGRAPVAYSVVHQVEIRAVEELVRVLVNRLQM